MPQWETILDKSSHISPVKIKQPKNHSTERLEILVKSKTTQKMSTEATPSSRKVTVKTILLSILLTFSLTCLSATIYCNSNYSNDNNAVHTVCSHVDHLPSPYKLYNTITDTSWIQHKKEKSKRWLGQTVEGCYETTIPFVSKIRQGYQWSETTSVKTALKETIKLAKSIIYTSENQLRLVYYAKVLQNTYITPLWTYTKETVFDCLVQLRHQMDDYIESGSIETRQSNEYNANNNNRIVEDKLKRTAKRILEYIDQINEESANTGMKQEEAREKAQEIIKSITDATNNDRFHLERKSSIINEQSTDVDKIAFEIQEIAEIASNEKTRLEEQLGLIQSKLSQPPLTPEQAQAQDMHLFIAALKVQVDQLRATAENSVRERAKLSLQTVENINANLAIKNRMKEDVQSAQRAALKDLRQVYIKLHQTNQLIDELGN